MSRRCLLVAGIFPPAGGAGAVRMAKLCKYLPRHGWEVDVVAPEGGGGWTRDLGLGADLDRTRVTRVRLPGGGARWLGGVRALAKDGGRNGWVQRTAAPMLRTLRALRDRWAVPDEHLAAVPFFVRAAVATARRGGYHALLTSSPPASLHLVGLLTQRATGLPWVAELRDPWVGNPARGTAGALRRFVDPWLERRVVTTADAITVVSPGMAHELGARYGGSCRSTLHVCANGFDPDDFADTATGVEEEATELLYAGSFDATLTPPDAALAAMAALADTAPELAARLRLRVIGGSDLTTAAALRAFVARHPVPAVTVEGAVPHREAARRMSRAGALLLVLAERTPWVLTSKVFEYLGSGRPILALVPAGDCRDLLERCGGCAVYAPSDIAGITGALRAIAAGEPFPVRSTRRPEVVQTYAWPELAGRLADLLVSVTHR